MPKLLRNFKRNDSIIKEEIWLAEVLNMNYLILQLGLKWISKHCLKKYI